MRTLAIAALLSVSICTQQNQEQYGQENSFEANWDSLSSRAFPQWFDDAKLGIFIHWGAYSVPAWCGPEQYAEWFLRGLQTGDKGRIAFKNRVYGKDFDYRSFADAFRAELFRPKDWAETFRRSGARYVVMVSKHHDGFALWPNAQAKNWNSVDRGPKRDLVGDLSIAVKAAGLRMGLYYSLPEWNNPIYTWGSKRKENDVDRYVREYMIPQFKDLCRRYKPSVIFSDGDWDHPASTWQSAELIRWIYDESGCPKDVVVNDRWGGGCNIGFYTPEYSAGILKKDRPWVECRGLGRSFGLNRAERLEAYLSPRALIHFFAQSVSHGGGMLLNIGPKADGQIPLLQQERLIQLGDWLTVNGEAIYGSKPWSRAGEYESVEITRIDPQLSFDWVRNSPDERIREDDFEATWTGFLEAPESGPVTFSAIADDGCTVEVDGQPVLAAGKGVDKNVAIKNGTLTLEKGRRYPIEVRFVEKKQNAKLDLRWKFGPHSATTIPQSQLFSSADKTVGDGLRAVYRSQRQSICYTTQSQDLYVICLGWPGDQVSLDLGDLAKDSVITMLGVKSPLTWRREGKQTQIDLSEIGPGELPCEHAWTLKISPQK